MKNTLLFICLLISVFASAQQGILDATFGSSIPAGTQQYSNPSTGFFEKAIAFQSDGKIVISTGGGLVSLGRLKTDGSEDPYFASNGWKNVGNYAIRSIAVQSDGKILATGKPTVISYMDQYLWRLNPDGSFDATFGQNGRVSDTTLGGSNECLALLAGGEVMWSGVLGFRKLLSDGTTDASWGNNGRLLAANLPIYVSNIIADTISGYVIASGYTKTLNNLAIIRLTPTGQVDPTFGYGGIDSLNYTVNTFGFRQELKLSPAGNIVLASDINDGLYNRVLCAVFNPDGTRNLGFGTNGAYIPIWNSPHEETFFGGFGVKSDESILIACDAQDTTVSGSYYDVVTQRVKSDGTYDATYGITRLDVNHANDLADAGGIGPDGKFVIVGKSGGAQLLARYTDVINSVNDVQQSTLHIYPNPASEVFSFEYSFTGNSILELIDLTGRIVMTKNLSADCTIHNINVNGISKGMYVITVRNEKATLFTERIAIE